jgi:hypothetical protein
VSGKEEFIGGSIIMTAADLWLNLGLGVLSGVISGVITGIGVTVYYRKKDNRQKWLKQFEDDKQAMSRFFNEVVAEIDFILSQEEYDFSYIIRTLPKAPPFTSYHHVDIDDAHKSATSRAYSLIDEMQVFFSQSKIDKKELFIQRSKLRIAQLNVLGMGTTAEYLENKV